MMQFFNRASEALVSPSFDPSAQTQSAEQPTGSLFLRDLPATNSRTDTSPASRAPAAAGSEGGLLFGATSTREIPVENLT